MVCIVSGILTLWQYLETSSSELKPERCPDCGKAGVWSHGHYPRKADRSRRGELNPILIPRYFCRHCRKTCSVLPECMPPRRWYLWCVQHVVLLHRVAKQSLHAVSQQVAPSRSTCRRWWYRFNEQFLLHRDALCAQLAELRQGVDFTHFWALCLSKLSLARAMLLCHKAGVAIP